MAISPVLWLSVLFLGLHLAWAQLRRLCPSNFPNSAICGAVNVPLDHSSQNSQNISVAYAILTPKDPSKRSRKVTFVFLNGGPGGSIIQNPIPALLDPGLPDLLGRPLLLVDYRGMGAESPLNCSLQRSFVPFEPPPKTLKKCLIEIGPQAVFYSTEAIARDLDITRATLGFEKLTMFGLSYGSRVAQAYSILFPSKVQSIVLDSPVPINQRDLYGRVAYRAYARILSLKNRDTPGFTNKKLIRDLSVVLKNLRRSPQLRESTGLNTSRIFTLYSRAVKKLPAALSVAARKSNYSQLQELVKQQRFFRRPRDARIYSFGASYSITCNDIAHVAPWRRAAKFFERKLALYFAIAYSVPETSFSPFTRGEGIDTDFKRCVGFPFPQKQNSVSGIPANVPVLTLYGTEDRNTPLEFLEDLHPAFKRTVALIGRTGHVTVGNPCAQRLVFEFVNTQAVRNASACI